MLSLRNFSKSYNDRLILKIDQLEFKKGAYWIKGENGSGKTTLFKSLSGILPFDGDITFTDGISAGTHALEFRKRITYSEAEPQFPGFLTAKDLMRFIGKIRDTTIKDQDRYAEMLGVHKFFSDPCETYSSGMMKKLGITLAFLGKPMVIILDEPLITLDQESREILFTHLRNKLNEGILLLISSHHTITPADIPVQQVYHLQNQTMTMVMA